MTFYDIDINIVGSWIQKYLLVAAQTRISPYPQAAVQTTDMYNAWPLLVT